MSVAGCVTLSNFSRNLCRNKIVRQGLEKFAEFKIGFTKATKGGLHTTKVGKLTLAIYIYRDKFYLSPTI